MLAVPVSKGVNVAWQVADAAAPAIRVQLIESKEPVKDVESVTVPAGAEGLAALVSVVVAVHVEPWFTITGVSHDTLVLVVRRLTVTLAAVLVLPECELSP